MSATFNTHSFVSVGVPRGPHEWRRDSAKRYF